MDDHAYSIGGQHKNILLCSKANLEQSDSQQRSANEISNEATSTADLKESAMETETLPDSSLTEVPETESTQAEKNKPHVCEMRSVRTKRKQRRVTHYNSSAKCCPYDQDPDYKNAAPSKSRRNKLKSAKNGKNKRKSPKSSNKTLAGPTSVTTNEEFLFNDDGNVVPKPPVSEDGIMQQDDQHQFLPTKRRSKRPHGPRPQRSKRQKPSPASPSVKPSAEIIKSEPKDMTDPSTCLVRTSTGNYELKCNNCPNTYMAATDLISHKLAAHDIPFLICEDCAVEFVSHEELNDHPCVARNRCDVCGIGCSSAEELVVHMITHSNDSKDYVCKVCLFSGRSQSELSRHMCGGRPKIKYSAKVSPAVMMYPTANNGVHNFEGVGLSPNLFVKTSKSGKPRHKVPNLQTSKAAASSLTGADSPGSQTLQVLCQECLNVYPSPEALASHECSAVPSADPVSMTPLAAPGVMPEVEQLAKFYSSVVFSE